MPSRPIKSFGNNFYLPADIARDLARERIGALAGSYTGASRSRRSLSDWTTSPGDADADMLWDLPELRRRSRDLDRNNPLACGAIKTKTTSVIGTGLIPQSQVDYQALGITRQEAKLIETQMEREFWLFAGGREFDVSRKLSFLQMQSLAYRSAKINGDCFAVRSFLERPGSPYGTKFQLIEADQVENEERSGKGESDKKGDSVNTTELAAGIKRNPLTGEPLEYQIRTFHPGSDFTTTTTWRKIPAFDPDGRPNVLHIYNPIRIGQTRGVPDLAPVIESFKQLGRYTESELMAAVVSSLFTVFIKSDSGDLTLEELAGAQSGGGSAEGLKMGNGSIVSLADGEDVQIANPSRPNVAFDPFTLAILRQIGAAIELPFEILVKHFTASYSAARAAMLEAWRYFKTERALFAEMFCQPIYEAAIEEAVAMGRIPAPGFLNDPMIRGAYTRARWVGPSPGQIDPVKETAAAEKQIDLKIATRAEKCIELTGGDFDAKINQIRYEEELLSELAGGHLGEQDAQGN